MIVALTLEPVRHDHGTFQKPRSYDPDISYIWTVRTPLCRTVSYARGLSLAHCFQDGGHLANHVSAFTRICLWKGEGAKHEDSENTYVSMLYFIIFYVFLGEI
ncbi:hypothetical protein E2C01_065319 [Portunus trituberculatus]|uniref:Uncharacterized protein n=1 Tax=Portunus trituberculatus TaxID=210409 RepID=A0A5B7HE67_PORTR|nr:hypothetical protein [Portunus trituberculatus]